MWAALICVAPSARANPAGNSAAVTTPAAMALMEMWLRPDPALNISFLLELVGVPPT
jgi:hypothetical protein